ncbi:hypothetical protein VRRI112168_03560 [Vreelandella rituensis]|uniref:Uncharacterized protein n=1 Tax=Vreelandella rituensis TaxID=2282306 RepID=A0A368U9F0_9GAMM|nr:hypothetical protein [Halomonas rituensis]RCV93730.1 hypothetical protein DU506_00830 [Halomonas rituensis]
MSRQSRLEKDQGAEVSALIDALASGMIAAPANVIAAVEAYPGPVSDWRARLVTQALEGVQEKLSLRRGEAAMVVPSNAGAAEIRRYRRQGWSVYRLEDLLAASYGPKTFRRLGSESLPKKRQERLRNLLADLSASRSALWPVMKALDAFYLSGADAPRAEHVSGKGRANAEVLGWAQTIWRQQRNDPVNTGLGLSREAAAKCWAANGAAWPDMAPDLPPRLLVIPEAESFCEAELAALLAQPCPIFCFGDPAVGVKNAAPESLRHLPLGSEVLAHHQAARLSCDQALEATIDQAVRNDVEFPDAWVQSLAALSGVALGRHRPGFDTFREKAGVADDAPRQAPLANDNVAPRAVVSRTGVGSLEYLLDALKPGASGKTSPKLLIEMDSIWASLVRDAFEVAQVMRAPRPEWDSRLARRFNTRAQALDTLLKNPDKARIAEMIERRTDLPVYPLLKALTGIEYRGVRVIHKRGLKDADYADGSEGRLYLGDRPDLQGLPANGTLLLAGEFDESTGGQAQAQWLYACMGQRACRVSAAALEAVDFIERATSWLGVRLTQGDPEQPDPVSASPVEPEDTRPTREAVQSAAEPSQADIPAANTMTPTTSGVEIPHDDVAIPMGAWHEPAAPVLEPVNVHDDPGVTGAFPEEAAFTESDIQPLGRSPDETIPPALREVAAADAQERATPVVSPASDGQDAMPPAFADYGWDDAMLDEAAAHEASMSGDYEPMGVGETAGGWDVPPSLGSSPDASPLKNETNGLDQWPSVVAGILQRKASASPRRGRGTTSNPGM